MSLIVILCAIPMHGAHALLTNEVIISGISEPVQVVAPPGDTSRLFMVEKAGRIRIITLPDNTLLSTPFLDISSLVNNFGERGLLALAFHPDYGSNGFFFIHYSNNSGNTVVARYQVSGDANIANAGSAQFFLTQIQPASNHNGGMIAFRPFDTNYYLYIGLGDGGGGGDPDENSQNLTNKLGKILRIDVDAGVPANPAVPYVPASNPFLDGAGGNDDSIWVFGLRNPWRFSFDRANGDLYIADVGQNAVEEIDYQPAASSGGENYGWDLLEGSADFECGDCDAARAATVLPIHEYTHADGFSVTGGIVYRGLDIPNLIGRYFFADLNGRVWSFAFDGSVVSDQAEHTSVLNPSGGTIVSFGEDAAGELYLVDIGGTIRKMIDPTPSEPIPAQSRFGLVMTMAVILGLASLMFTRRNHRGKGTQ
ncbi:MAG: hypothetical protein COA73_03740 [Candidatus Hydrogenedentota bacterium]|nr:MAG: hypothetical protein COA73_03740 [Candidatus Hydrogenedentota bacterium]